MGLFKKYDPIKDKQKKFSELEHSSGNPELVNFQKATWLTSRGNNFGQKKMYEEAKADFEEAIILKSDHLPAHISLAVVYRELGDEARALQILEEAPEKMMFDGKVITTKIEALEGSSQ